MNLTDYIEYNFAEIYARLNRRISFVLLGVSIILLIVLLGYWPLPVTQLIFLIIIFALGGFGYSLGESHPVMVANVISLGLLIMLVCAMFIFNEPWLPFMGIPLIFLMASILRGSEWVAGVVIAGVTTYLFFQGIREYQLELSLVCIASSVSIAWIITSSLYTPLEWAWAMKQRADELLEIARDRQAELARTLQYLRQLMAIGRL